MSNDKRKSNIDAEFLRQLDKITDDCISLCDRISDFQDRVECLKDENTENLEISLEDASMDMNWVLTNLDCAREELLALYKEE